MVGVVVSDMTGPNKVDNDMLHHYVLCLISTPLRCENYSVSVEV